LHGYAITSLIRRQTDEALLVEEGTLYPALWRLESKGLVEAEWGLSENNRKAKFYRLTSDGRRHLRQETRTWEAYATAVSKVLGATQPPLAEER
jgi:PadR family transcriptional regulator, regulatory protein PadR